jgi:hypothetical protein
MIDIILLIILILFICFAIKSDSIMNKCNDDISIIIMLSAIVIAPTIAAFIVIYFMHKYIYIYI